MLSIPKIIADYKLFRKFQKKGAPKLPAPVTFREEYGCKCLNQLPVKIKNDIVFVDVEGVNPVFPSFRTNVNISEVKSWGIGSHNYTMDKSQSQLDGLVIRTDSTRQHEGIGEVMRLVSIMEMRENGLDKITMESRPKALPFHWRYLFRPNIELNINVQEILKEIASRSSPKSSEYETAKELLKTWCLTDTTETQPIKLLENINTFVSEYIKKNIGRWSETHFDREIPLVLDSETVAKNADFYNKLFEKHQIDYRL